MRKLLAVVVLAWLPLPSPAADAANAFVATQARPRVEYWQQRQQEIGAALARPQELRQVRLLFIGDSITDFWLLDDNPWVTGQKFGRSVWNESFTEPGNANFALNIGISGDRLEHLLYRLLPVAAGGLGHLDPPELQPEFILLMVGINNTWAPEPPVIESVTAGIHAVVDALRRHRPRARIILQSLLPTQDERKNAEVVRPVNARLQQATATAPLRDHVLWLDLYSAFVDADGRQVARYFDDGLHPNAAGYRQWRDRLVPFLECQRRQGKTAQP